MKILPLKRNGRGFTLVELIIYIGLLAIVLGILSTVFSSLTAIQLESESNSSIDQDERFIISRLSYDIRRASSITTPATVGASGSSLVLVIGGTSYTYSVANNKLMLVGGIYNDQLNSAETKVTGATFTREGNSGGKNSITFTITEQSTTTQLGGKVDARTITSTVGIR